MILHKVALIPIFTSCYFFPVETNRNEYIIEPKFYAPTDLLTYEALDRGQGTHSFFGSVVTGAMWRSFEPLLRPIGAFGFQILFQCAYLNRENFYFYPYFLPLQAILQPRRVIELTQ